LKFSELIIPLTLALSPEGRGDKIYCNLKCFLLSGMREGIRSTSLKKERYIAG